MEIPFIGEVKDKKTYSATAYALGEFINVKLYWDEKSTNSQLKAVSDFLNHIENVIQDIIVPRILFEINNESIFLKELMCSAYKGGVANIFQSLGVNIDSIINNLVVRDVFISPKDGCIAFHVYFSRAKNEMIEVLLDFSLSFKSCDIKIKSEYLSVDGYSYFDFKELGCWFDDEQYRDLEKAVEWVELIDNKKSERLRCYLGKINKYQTRDQRGIIGEDAWHASKSFLELEGLYKAYRYFYEKDDCDLKEHIKFIAKGSAFKHQSDNKGNDKCRDYLFELKVASEYLRTGYDVSVNERADIVINKRFYIECKKVSSKKKFIVRLSDAIDQLSGESGKGIVYIDATDLIDVSYDTLLINDRYVDLPDKSGHINTDERIKSDLQKAVVGRCESFLRGYQNKISDKLGNYLLVVHFEFSCLHFSPIHQRAANLVLRYLISNENDSEIKCLAESSFKNSRERGFLIKQLQTDI